MIDAARLHRALETARRELLAAREPHGHWTGELSSSALSTATAVCALALYDREGGLTHPQINDFVWHGLDWLARHANEDGGWGDTVLSVSNISTTTLAWAAFGVVSGADAKYRPAVRDAERWLQERAGELTPERLAEAIIQRYGKDRTFSAPILTHCALSGRFGPGKRAWRNVIPLPFELAACPPAWFAFLRLPVVSYALPALIAIGQARHHHSPSRNPLARGIRNATRARTLKVLESIQPANGGFLEATPLTSFVTMSLAASGQASHPVARKGVEFLLASRRTDGSWPIDTNLATWVSTLSVNALANGAGDFLTAPERQAIRNWLLAQQYREIHPYTQAPPGAWAWTDLPGGVPDADDTAGALLALHALSREELAAKEVAPALRQAVEAGIGWLLDLQNGDGGIPTFCRGWTNLPFDRSGADLTAHALHAWQCWHDCLSVRLQIRVQRATSRAIRYLQRSQARDGSWVPLWFGNQFAPDDENAIYGTARVLIALQQVRANGELAAMLQSGANFLIKHQRTDGSWGAGANGPASIEETALALEALAGAVMAAGLGSDSLSAAIQAVDRGAQWLAGRIEAGTWRQPSPIGFYFAKLWYFEQLYPLIFTVGALAKVARLPDRQGP